MSDPRTPGLAAQIMAIEVLSKLLISTEGEELPEKILEEIREFSGARTVLLIVYSESPSPEKRTFAQPKRRSELFSSQEVEELCSFDAVDYDFIDITKCSEGTVQQILSRKGVNSALRFHLKATGKLVGTLLIFDLPEVNRLKDVLDTFLPLLPLIALALRNSISRQRIEFQAKLLERQAQELEHRVLERTIDLQRANEALKESSDHHRTILQTALSGFMVADRNGFIREVNQSYIQMSGYSEEELLGMNVTDLERLHSEQEVKHNLDEMAKKGFGRFESKHRKKDGTVYDVEISIQYRPSEGGIFVTFMRDITERKRYEQTLSEERERLSVTIQSIGDGVITTDGAGKVTLLNTVAENLCGWKADQVLGWDLSAVFNTVDEFTGKPRENPAKQVLATGETIELAQHTVLVSRDGQKRVIADSAAPIKDSKGFTIGVVLVFRDMTEKLKMLEAMQRTDKLEALGVLAGGIAHDFNNLLGGIFGFVSLAKVSTAENSGAGIFLEKATSVFNRAKALTHQLLTFSKGGEPQREVGPVGSLLEEVSSFAISGTDIVCDYHIDKDLWPCNFDKNQIGQVIDNLVINACQAMPSGGRITITATNQKLLKGEVANLEGGDYLHIQLKDQGVGIPHDIILKIFDPFFTTKPTGNGLGLATCNSIISKHGGALEVESQLGVGSVFHIYLPRAEERIKLVANVDSKIHFGKGTFLVMDDEPFLLDILREMLKNLGYDSVGASDGAMALELIKKTSLCGAILDLTIKGGQGGLKTLEAIRVLHPLLPVFASSGFSGDPVMANPIQFGFTDSIQKPFLQEDLIRLLERNLSRP